MMELLQVFTRMHSAHQDAMSTRLNREEWQVTNLKPHFRTGVRHANWALRSIVELA